MPIDVSSAAALVASTQHSIQIVKALLGTRDGALEREKTFELREKLFAVLSDAMNVQAALSAAQEEIRELKERIVQFEQWDARKERYELKRLELGNLVYAPKVTEGATEPEHYLCANCFEQRFPSILQRETDPIGHAQILCCPRCKTELVIRGMRQPTPPPARRR